MIAERRYKHNPPPALFPKLGDTMLQSFYTDTLPETLVALNQWVTWRAEPDPNRPGKIRKIPINARNGRNAQSTNPATWSTFETAVKRARASGEGIGFCLDPDHLPLIAVDIDHCIVDGRLAPAAWDMVRMCGSYTEVTPSGAGLRIIMRGLLPAALVRHDLNIEIYESARYITVTGDALSAAPNDINTAPAAFYAWYDAHRRRPQERPQPAQERRQAPLQLDVELIERAQGAANGAKFHRLWTGDSSGYASTSEADFALATLLAWWTQNDAGRVARLLCQSGLHRPKFDAVHSSSGETYAELTARRACERNTTVYDPTFSGPQPIPPRPGPRAASVTTAVLNETQPVNFELIAAYREKRLNGRDLAEQFFKTPREEKRGRPAELPRWFTGEYPEGNAGRTCKTHWRMRAKIQKVVSAAPQPWDNWRGFVSQNTYVPPCPHCQHERALAFCQHIEKASELYRFENMLCYIEMTAENATAAAARIRQRNQRKEDHIFHTSFPIDNDMVIVLHDANYYLPNSIPLPADRAALYTLVRTWALATPVGKRAGHGLGTWGVMRKKSKSKSKPKNNKPTQDKHSWWIQGVNWGKVQTLLEGYLDAEVNPRGNKLDLDAFAVLDALIAAGVHFEVKGDVPPAIMSHLADKEKLLSANRDTPAKKRPAALHLSEVIDDIPGF